MSVVYASDDDTVPLGRRVDDCGDAMRASVVLIAQPRANPNAPRFPLPTEPRVYDTFEQKIRVTVIARGIERPWMLTEENDGAVLKIEPAP